MDDEIEDMVGELKLTDSQKSVTSNVYTCDFTDSSSDKNNSSGKDTYVIDCDESDESESCEFDDSKSIINIFESAMEGPHSNKDVPATRGPAVASSELCVVSQEIFTQTSKIIIQLVQSEMSKNSHTLETQTSNVCIIETRTVEHLNISPNRENTVTLSPKNKKSDHTTFSVKIPTLGIKRDEDSVSDDSIADVSNKELNHSDNSLGACYANSGYLQDFNSDSTFGDSTIECNEFLTPKHIEHSETSEVPTSVDNEVEELYNKLSETLEVEKVQKTDHVTDNLFRTLTPLTEESTIKKDSIIDITPKMTNFEEHEEDPFAKSYGINVDILQNDTPTDTFKLPPISKSAFSPRSPHLNVMLTVNTPRYMSKSDTPLQCVRKDDMESIRKLTVKNFKFAAGEKVDMHKADEASRSQNSVRLPPIHGDTHAGRTARERTVAGGAVSRERASDLEVADQICIDDRIRELTASRPRRRFSGSPASRRGSSSPPVSERACSELAERGADALCCDLLRRLRSVNWVEVSDVLEDLPRALDKFWDAIAEQRVADLIRQVSVHIESPRTQVARLACGALATIIKNTNYTRKPEFNAAVSCLLVKTGSFNRCVRRAANVALDVVACAVPATHAAAALAALGVSHKNPLVRCASARLLVVCAAMAGGGRDLLRSRPSLVAQARRMTLRSLSVLLGDKNTDARKYAERLYSMLRPLPSFEAFYLTDVDVEVASAQMKKYDALLAPPCGST